MVMAGGVFTVHDGAVYVVFRDSEVSIVQAVFQDSEESNIHVVF